MSVTVKDQNGHIQELPTQEEYQSLLELVGVIGMLAIYQGSTQAEAYARAVALCEKLRIPVDPSVPASTLCLQALTTLVPPTS